MMLFRNGHFHTPPRNRHATRGSPYSRNIVPSCSHTSYNRAWSELYIDRWSRQLNLLDKIQQAASRNFSAPAFIHDGKVLTYRDFYTLLCAAVKVLHERGIRPGEVVGISLDQSPLHIIIMLALARLGAVSIPVHPVLPQVHREKLARKYAIKTIVSHREENRIDGVAFIKLDTVSAAKGAADINVTDYVPDAEMPFRISLSSGTTGEPKGVLITQGNLLDRIEKLLYECDNNSRVITFDLNFALGFVFAIGVLTVGGTIVFPRSYKPEGTIEAINLHAVTHVFIPPVMLMRMATLLPEGDGVAFPSLKHLRVVGGKTSSALLNELHAKFTPHVFVVYGLTELGAITIATPKILASWPNSSGKVLPWAKVEIRDENDKAVAKGISGEIRVKLDGMPTEYFNGPDQTAKKFRKGWFYTGDSGMISKDGILFIEGRMDDVINLDGHKLSPGHIEETLTLHPDVREAVAFAMQDDSGERALVAAIIPHTNGIRQDDLLEFAKQQLGIFYPKRLFIMRDFPRNPNGKILRDKVSDLALKML